MLRAQVDRSACRGAKACVRRAPGTFSLDAEGRSVVAESPGDSDPAIREAAASCPFFAITLEEGDGD